jgi:hypothetical protein
MAPPAAGASSAEMVASFKEDVVFGSDLPKMVQGVASVVFSQHCFCLAFVGGVFGALTYSPNQTFDLCDFLQSPQHPIALIGVTSCSLNNAR